MNTEHTTQYEAINDYIIVRGTKNDTFQSQILECEVIETTKQSEKLQGRTVFIPRTKVFELPDGEEEEVQTSGIILAGSRVTAVAKLEDVVAIKKHD